VCARGGRLILVGLGVGVPLAAAVIRLMAATLMDLVEPGAASIAPLAAVVGALGVLATFLPARPPRHPGRFCPCVARRLK
jgi:hypothetical protein